MNFISDHMPIIRDNMWNRINEYLNKGLAHYLFNIAVMTPAHLSISRQANRYLEHEFHSKSNDEFKV